MKQLIHQARQEIATTVVLVLGALIWLFLMAVALGASVLPEGPRS
jgi:hypothetical protein